MATTSPRDSYVLFRVQHAAGRDEPLARLLSGMPAETEVVTDEAVHDPNPWRNYKRCLADLPSEATHVAVVQDDVLVCRNFGEAVQRLVAARPDDLLSLFVGGLRGRSTRNMLEALRAGQRWTQLEPREIVHVVALIWPRSLAEEFLRWAETARLPGHRTTPRSDDAIVGTWVRLTRRRVWAACPSLVEHPDDTPTLIHRRERAAAGADKGRTAVAWIGSEIDPLSLDWNV